MSRVRRPPAYMDEDDYEPVARHGAGGRRGGVAERYDDDDAGYDDGYGRGGYDRRARRVRDVLPDDDDMDAPRGGGVAATARRLGLGAVALAFRHPVPTIGGATTLALMTAITLNATTSQPGHHPSPLFETRPYADAATTAAVPQPRVKPSPQSETAAEPAQTASFGVAQPRMKPIATTGEPSAVVKELQALMTARGLYRGEVDGVVGPGTTDAIKALERSLGLVQTGEPSDRLLAYARERAAPGTLATAPLPTPAPGFAAAPPPSAPQVASTAAPAPGTVAVPVAAPAPVVAPPPAPAPVARAVPVKPPAEKPVVVATQPKAVPVTRPAGQRAVPVVPQPQPGTIATAPAPENRLARVQRALSAAGFGPLRSDGVLDDPTVDAIRRYEVHRGWAPTGRLSDRLTLDLLMKSANR